MILNSKSLNKLSIIFIFFSLFILSGVIFSRILITALKRQNKTDIPKANINVYQRVNGKKTGNNTVLGEESYSLKKLPESFPTDFPIYPQAEITDVWQEKGDRVDAFSIIWRTKDNPIDVSRFFIEKLDTSSWEKQIILESNDSYTLSFQKEKIQGFMGITKEDESKTLISITMGIEINKEK
ncbi:hypothetical protein A2Z22_04430 [Candidatus Woesebacteria bacterium RBG_16_34_12]|uniref:Uncharacterized protein n=1 Tax=Candidatus Woesebacteria bacterium RBG_16_34_12 TaxID=1802480 RepID=A0A1F7XBL4_9BACT|nr:MAG: hypothetical protein A2Z22_04430 [Candidatus Woesebacteria bacterium RBG_16_34_12]